jgi:hypothetical protein
MRHLVGYCGEAGCVLAVRSNVWLQQGEKVRNLLYTLPVEHKFREDEVGWGGKLLD